MLTGIKILVVEDNVVNQKITHFMLKKLHADVVIAMDGNEAIGLLAEHNFDVILMDLQMPGMDGYAATRYIRREMHNNTPIIAVTADIFVSETNQYKESGMNASISKPFELHCLGELILELVKEPALASNQIR